MEDNTADVKGGFIFSGFYSKGNNSNEVSITKRKHLTFFVQCHTKLKSMSFNNVATETERQYHLFVANTKRDVMPKRTLKEILFTVKNCKSRVVNQRKSQKPSCKDQADNALILNDAKCMLEDNKKRTDKAQNLNFRNHSCASFATPSLYSSVLPFIIPLSVIPLFFTSFDFMRKTYHRTSHNLDKFNILSHKFWIWLLLFQQLALSSVVALRSSEICKQIRGLTPQQRSMCQARPDAIIYVSEGAQLGMSECRWQFRHNRWNCTTKGNQTVFGSELRIASKEKAFDYAIKSAGVLYAIVTACGRGLLSDCGCASKRGYYRTRRTTKRGSLNQIVERDRAKAWRWGGCSVDIAHGLNFTREFMDAREIRQNERSLMNIHNNEAGRLAITRRLKKACRCHGVSGSCTMRTCWITLPSFREVGNILKRRYESAKNVVAMRGGSRGRPQFLKLWNQKRDVFVKPAIRDLVFLDRSPSFCDKNDRIGIFGTRERKCTLAGRGERTCSNMCCNRGYRTVQYVKKEACKCKFFWCCTVQCEFCLKNATNHTCN